MVFVSLSLWLISLGMLPQVPPMLLQMARFSSLLWLGIYVCMLLLFSRLVVSDSLVTPRTVAHQTSLSMGFQRQEILEWVAISFSKGSSLTQRLNLCLLHWQANSLQLCTREDIYVCIYNHIFFIHSLSSEGLGCLATVIMLQWHIFFQVGVFIFFR